jgi:hypothetical protein
VIFTTRARLGLAAALFVVCCLPMIAAPVAPRAPAEQYLPDDASVIVTINIKQAAGSELYTKHFQKRFEDLLNKEGTPPFVKAFVTALLRGGERATLAVGLSGFAEPSNSGPTIIIEARLGELEDALKKAAKDKADTVKTEKVGEATLYDIGKELQDQSLRYMVLPNRNSLVIVPRKEAAVEALQRAAGSKKAELKSAALKEMLGRMRPDVTVQFAATEEMVTWSEARLTDDMGVKKAEHKHHTLAEEGIKSAEGSALVGTNLQGSARLLAKDEETAAKLRDTMSAGLKEAVERLKKLEEGGNKEVAVVRKALEKVEIGGKGQTIRLAATLDADNLEGLIKGLFMPMAVSDAKPVPAVGPDKKKDKP